MNGRFLLNKGDAKVMGVASGLADYTGVDLTIIRLGFIDAQQGTVEQALTELRTGRKQSHWMWFIFPQLAGLGRSPTAQHYAIRSIGEASAYLAHEILGARLRLATEALLPWAAERTADSILGATDAMKLRSSLTLFDRVQPNCVFGEALAAFFDSPDERTLALLNGQR